MPALDCTELFTDPDFCTEFTVIRRVQVCNEYGETSITETRIPTVGVIQWSSTTYNKMEQGTHFDKDITIYSKIPLYVLSATGYCDIIEWNGCRYMVKDIQEDAADWGSGFMVATATLV